MMSRNLDAEDVKRLVCSVNWTSRRSTAGAPVRSDVSTRWQNSSKYPSQSRGVPFVRARAASNLARALRCVADDKFKSATLRVPAGVDTARAREYTSGREFSDELMVLAAKPVNLKFNAQVGNGEYIPIVAACLEFAR